jgi:hypothetical protein
VGLGLVERLLGGPQRLDDGVVLVADHRDPA